MTSYYEGSKGPIVISSDPVEEYLQDEDQLFKNCENIGKLFLV
jgi:hypothetical protein